MFLLGTALAAAILVTIQLALITWQGQAACLNEGCRVVEGLTRVSPFVFNLFGLLFFLAVAAGAALQRRRASLAPYTALMLLAAMAAEGVLLAYQYHVAQAWCSYCLIIFALVALCNLVVGFRQFCSALVLVAAVNIIFALLRFEPQLPAGQGNGLDAGTAAVRAGAAGGKHVFLIYSKDCPHCLALLRKLPEFPACTFHLNPISSDQPQGETLNLERRAEFHPERNLQLLRLLNIETVPVLVVAENDILQIHRKESCIESYLYDNCTGSPKSSPLIPGQGQSGTTTEKSGQPFSAPGDDKDCRINTECTEPAAPFLEQPQQSR